MFAAPYSQHNTATGANDFHHLKCAPSFKTSGRKNEKSNSYNRPTQYMTTSNNILTIRSGTCANIEVPLPIHARTPSSAHRHAPATIPRPSVHIAAVTAAAAATAVAVSPPRSPRPRSKNAVRQAVPIHLGEWRRSAHMVRWIAAWAAGAHAAGSGRGKSTEESAWWWKPVAAPVWR